MLQPTVRRRKLSKYDVYKQNNLLLLFFKFKESTSNNVSVSPRAHFHLCIHTFVYLHKKNSCVLWFQIWYKTNNVSYLHFRSLLLSISTSESRATSKTLSLFTNALLDFLPQMENKLLLELLLGLLLPLSAPAKCTTWSSPAKQLQVSHISQCSTSNSIQFQVSTFYYKNYKKIILIWKVKNFMH